MYRVAIRQIVFDSLTKSGFGDALRGRQASGGATLAVDDLPLVLVLLVMLGGLLEALLEQRPFGLLRGAGGHEKRARGQQDGTEKLVSCHEIHPV